MAAKSWSTNWPTAIDTTNELKTISDGDLTDFSQANTIAQLFIAIETEIGATSPAAGSLRYRVAALEAAPPNHAAAHQNGGGDEISVAGLSGLLADDQNPVNHAGDHQNGGGDEISVAGLSGLLADDQNPVNHASDHDAGGTDAMAIDAVAGTGSLRTLGTGAQQACAGNDGRLSDSRDPINHASDHQNGGGDEISVAGLSGLLADDQNPVNHASDHDAGGTDAMAIDAVAGTGSLRTLGTGAQQACAGNDGRLSDTRDPNNHASDHEPGGTDTMAVDAAAGTGSLRTLGTGATNACAGNDGRLTDARTPTAHNLAGGEHNADTLSNLDGKVSDYNLGSPVTAQASTPITLNATDSGKLYTNEGCAAEIVFTLPTAAAGLEFTFVVQDILGIKVTAAAGDTIRVAGSVSLAAGTIDAATAGDTVKIKAINATEWIALFYIGTWTVT
jgi:hypothetical protein